MRAEAQLGREDPGSGTLFVLYVSQVHERAIIVVKQGKGALVDFVWQGRRRSRDELDIRGILEERANDAKYLPKKLLFTSMRGSVFAIFTQKTCQCRPFQYGQKSSERATLMYWDTPSSLPAHALKGLRGSFGELLTGYYPEDWENLPRLRPDQPIKVPKLERVIYWTE